MHYNDTSHCNERLYASGRYLSSLTNPCLQLRNHIGIIVIVRRFEVVAVCRNLLQALLFGAETNVG